MALMLGKLCKALRAGGAPDDEAREAAEEVAAFENRLANVESDLRLLKWMAGTNAGLTLIVLASVLAMWAKIGEMAGQIMQIARTVVH